MNHYAINLIHLQSDKEKPDVVFMQAEYMPSEAQVKAYLTAVHGIGRVITILSITEFSAEEKAEFYAERFFGLEDKVLRFRFAIGQLIAEAQKAEIEAEKGTPMYALSNAALKLEAAKSKLEILKEIENLFQ